MVDLFALHSIYKLELFTEKVKFTLLSTFCL